ncbi:EpsG family protein [Flavobacterium sp. ZS1P14]|uniref:EpsG family protein n=1 Tax=Flavobacterium sp. ZS1P14 TaxID=3401729 RepID=UPI003AAD2B1B
MEVYIITLLVFFLFSFFEIRCELTEKQKRILRIILFVILVFQVGFRWKTGTDWPPYLNHFNNTFELSDTLISILSGFEPGYAFFVLLVKKMSDDYTVFLVIHTLIYYFLVFHAFKKLSPFYFTSLMIFYVTTLGVMGSNRQLIALAICLYSLKYIIDKNAFKFFLLIGIAFLFHSTALIFCVFFFLNKDIRKIWIIGVLFLSFILGKTNLPFFIFSFVGNSIGGASANKADFYTEGAKDFLAENPLGIFGLIKRLFFLVLFSLNYNFLTAKLKYYKLIFNGYYFGLIFYFLFSSTLLILVNRGSLYFNVMECFLLASQFLIIKTRLERSYILVLLLVVCVFLLFQSISVYSDLFVPYKGILINTGFDREMR